MNTKQVIKRARKAINGGCRYELGYGGKLPDGAFPWDSKYRCDCSGFTAWVLKLHRETDHPLYVKQNGGWINTTAMWRDGMSSVGFFDRLDRAIPGAMLVFPGSGGSPGHIGVISKVAPTGEITAVIHCSSRNHRRTGDAIQENSAPLLVGNSNSIIILYHGIETELTRSRRSKSRYG